jgi:cephalosporin hydroxylase
MKTIHDLHTTHTGKTSDKYSSYLTTYDRIFLPFRDAPVRLLEIGVQNGGSLEVWSEYFARAERIVGCDIDPKCGELRYEDGRISVVVGDVNVEETYKAVTAISGTFDIIIDDASHVSDNILRTFLIYFPLLTPGGLFVVEDTHTLYWKDFQGGILKQTTAQAFFKQFADLVNYEHWNGDLPLEGLFGDFPPPYVQPFLREGWVEGVEFYNSMVVVRKAMAPSHAKLGQRVVVGDEALVCPVVLEYRNPSGGAE